MIQLISHHNSKHTTIDRNPTSRETNIVLLIQIRKTIIDNNLYNPRPNAPRRIDHTLSA